jgi:hypothetical protein
VPRVLDDLRALTSDFEEREGFSPNVVFVSPYDEVQLREHLNEEIGGVLTSQVLRGALDLHSLTLLGRRTVWESAKTGVGHDGRAHDGPHTCAKCGLQHREPEAFVCATCGTTWHARYFTFDESFVCLRCGKGGPPIKRRTAWEVLESDELIDPERVRSTGMAHSIPKAAPETTREAFGRVLDLAEAVSGLRMAGMSSSHPLELPAEAMEKLVEAHQALLAAHRVLEASLVGRKPV